MTPSQKRLRELKNRQSTERQRMAELSLEDTLTTETRAELDDLEKSTPDLERQIRAAVAVCETEDRESVVTAGPGAVDEDPARAELRSRCTVGNYLLSAFQGGQLAGAEAELVQELGLSARQVPLEIFETRAISQSPTTGTGCEC